MHTPERSQNLRARPWQSLEPPLLLRAPAAQGNHSLPLLPPAPPHSPIGAGRNQRREGSRRQTRRSDAAVEARPPPLLRRQCLRAMCHVTTLTYLRPLTNLARHALTHLASRALTNLASPALTHPAILPRYPNCVRQSHRSPPCVSACITPSNSEWPERTSARGQCRGYGCPVQLRVCTLSPRRHALQQ